MFPLGGAVTVKVPFAGSEGKPDLTLIHAESVRHSAVAHQNHRGDIRGVWGCHAEVIAIRDGTWRGRD